MTAATRIGRLSSTSAAASGAVAVLAAALRDGAVARWLEPRPDARHLLSEGYFAGVVHRLWALGQVAVAPGADCHPGDRLDGVALWTRHPPPTHHETDTDLQSIGGACGSSSVVGECMWPLTWAFMTRPRPAGRIAWHRRASPCVI